VLADLLGRTGRAGVVVSGERGVGRSRVLDAVAAQLREQGLPVQRLTVRRSSTPLPDAPPLPSPGGRPGEEPPVVIVDDGHLLDEEAAAGLHDLTVTGRIRLLITLPTGVPHPEPIAALCRDSICERVLLSPLGQEACDTLVTVLAGRPADAATARQIWTLTGGLPRLITDLVRGLLESGLLVPEGGTWSWAPAGQLPETFLADALGDRLDGLLPHEQDALDLLLCTGPVGTEILVGAGADLDALESLESRGLVTAQRSGRRLLVEVPDPLLALAAHQRIGRLRRRRLGLRLAEAWERRGRRRSDDLARSAGLLLDAGGTPPPEIAERGARQAAARANYPLAERLARSALASGAGASAAGRLAEALSSQDRAAEAESALQRAGATGTSDPSLQLVRAANLRWGLADRETSEQLVEDVLRTPSQEHVRAAAHLNLGGFQLHDGRFLQALELAEGVKCTEPPGSPRWYQALAISISALYSLGRDREAVEQADIAQGALSGDPDSRPGLPSVILHQLTASVTRARLVHGDLDAAEHLAQATYTSSSHGSLLAIATWASFLGEVALVRGLVSTAVRLQTEAQTAAQRSGRGGLAGRAARIMVIKNLARALIASGQPDAARQALTEMGAADLDSLAAVDLWTGDVSGALVAATSNTARGVAVVLRKAERARDRAAWGIYVPALHQAVRLGGASQVPNGTLDGVTVQGPLLSAQADHVRAAISGNTGALLDVAQRYVQVGAYLYAAEAAAEASRLATTAGQGAAARRAASLAQACAARCEDLMPQLIAQLREPAELTPRQREIARLATQGMPSKVIAERLVVSVRTVDNCLGEIYRKLGISNRAELAQVMGLLDGDHPAAGSRTTGSRGTPVHPADRE
jgi:DNA-binding CsgD family transcriptional regulator